MKTERVCEIVGKNEEIQGEKVICLVFVCVKVCMVCSQGDYKNSSVFLAVWLQHHKLVPLTKVINLLYLVRTLFDSFT